MKLIKKFFSFSIGSFVGIFISILSLPILTRIISPEEFGYATLFLNIGLVLSVLAMAGVDQAFIRYFHQSNQQTLFKKTLLVSLSASFLIGITIYIFDDEFSNLILEENSYVFLMCFYILCLILSRFANLILRMQQFAIRFSVVEVTRKVCDFLFVIGLALLFIPNHYALILGYSLSLLISGIISLLLSRKFWSKPNENFNEVPTYKEILSYSVPFMLSGALLILIQTLDKILLGYWGTAQEVGIYSASFKLVALISIVQHTFNLFWTPVYLENYKDFPEDNELYSKVSRLMTIIMLSLCVLVILSKDFIILFLGSDYQKQSSLIAALVLMPALMTMSETTMIGINLKLKAKYHLYISLVVLFISLTLNIILIPLAGMKGAAFSVAVSYITFYLLRTIVGQKLVHYEIKLKSTLILIMLILTWISIILFYSDSSYVIYSGAIIILVLLFTFFFDDIKYSKKFISNLRG